MGALGFAVTAVFGVPAVAAPAVAVPAGFAGALAAAAGVVAG